MKTEERTAELVARLNRAEANLRSTILRHEWLEDAKEVWRAIAEEALGEEEAGRLYHERMDAIQDTSVDL